VRNQSSKLYKTTKAPPNVEHHHSHSLTTPINLN
jgi:hypothetical protein